MYSTVMAISKPIISLEHRASNKWSDKGITYSGSKARYTRQGGYKLYEGTSRCAADITTYSLFEEIKSNWKRPGKSTGDSIRGELHVLLIKLFINYCNNPHSVLSTPRAQKYARPLGLDHNRFKTILNALEKLGYIHTHKGNSYEGLTSRSMPAPKLIHQWLNDDWNPKKLKLKPKGGYLMTMKDSEKKLYPTSQWLNTASHTEKPSLDYLKGFNKVFQTMGVKFHGSKFDMTPGQLHRVFNNGTWSNGGRFYGHHLQSLPSIKRTKLLIEGEPVVELDFQSLHLVMAYHNRGGEALEALDKLQAKGDLYDGVSHEGLAGDGKLPEENIKLLNGKSALRAIKKRLTLIAFNAATDSETIAGAIKEFQDDPELKGLIPSSRKTLHSLLATLLINIKIKHECIAGQLATGKGVLYQYLDSMVMEKVMRFFLLDLQIPLIPIHDSIVIQEKYQRLGKAVLEVAHLTQWEGLIPVTCEPDMPRDNYIEHGSSFSESDINFRKSVLSSIKKTLFEGCSSTETKLMAVHRLALIWNLESWKDEIESLVL